MSQYTKFNNESENMKSTIDLMEQNYKNSINNDNKKVNGNIDINRNYEEEPIIENKRENIDINAETKSTDYYNKYYPHNRFDEEGEKLGNFTQNSDENKILNICGDINNKIKKFQIIPLYIQKEGEKKFLLVKKNMTLREILFINFKVEDAHNYEFYNGKSIVNMDETIEDQNITPLSNITDYRVIK